MGFRTSEGEGERGGNKGLGLSPEILCFPILPPVIYISHDGVGHIPIIIIDDGNVNPPPPPPSVLPPPPQPQPQPQPQLPLHLRSPPSFSTPQPYRTQAQSQSQSQGGFRVSNAQTAQKASNKAPLYPQTINLYHDYFQTPPPPPPQSKPAGRSRAQNPSRDDQTAQSVPVSASLPPQQSNISWSLPSAVPRSTYGSHNSQTQAQTNQSAQRVTGYVPLLIPPLQYNSWVDYIQALQAASAAALQQTYRSHYRMDQAVQGVPHQKNKWSDYIQEPYRTAQGVPHQKTKWTDYVLEPYRTDRTFHRASTSTLQPPKIEKFDYIQSTALPPTARPTYRTETQAVPSQCSSTDLDARWASLAVLLPHIQWYELIQAATNAALAGIAPPTPIPPPPSAPIPTPPPSAPPRPTSRAAAASSSAQTQNVADEHQTMKNQWKPPVPQQQLLQPVTEVTRGRPRMYEDIKHSITYDRFSSEEYSWLPPGWYAEERTRTTGHIDVQFYHVDTEKQFRSKAAVMRYLQEQQRGLDSTNGEPSKKRKTS